MPRKFWLMPDLKFRKLSVEVPTSQCAYALDFAARLTEALFLFSYWY
jgi:hypothetical protein